MWLLAPTLVAIAGYWWMYVSGINIVGHGITGYMWLLAPILAAIAGYWWMYVAGINIDGPR